MPPLGVQPPHVPFLLFSHFTKAQPECTKAYYKPELQDFEESPGFTLTSSCLSTLFDIKTFFLLKAMAWGSLNFATCKQTQQKAIKMRKNVRQLKVR